MTGNEQLRAAIERLETYRKSSMTEKCRDTYRGTEHSLIADNAMLARAFIERHLAGDFADAERFRVIQDRFSWQVTPNAPTTKQSWAVDSTGVDLDGETFREAIDNAAARAKREGGK
jgi:hypothetical protein